jgi:lysophospholipase L1-like esterase
MMRRTVIALLALVLMVTQTQAADPPKLELKNGDRIVYLGNTFVERDAAYGYLETMLTIRHPDINFTFRNLGWSGDTVWGDARARFGTRADGFKHLKEDVFALKPTIILVAYGMNESFAGEAGLKEFEEGLNTLLDTLAETKAKIVLISPIPHENYDPTLPDSAKHNADLKLYCQAIAKVATEREILFINYRAKADAPGYQPRLPGQSIPTDDGIHPTELGYSMLVPSIANVAFKYPSSIRGMVLATLSLNKDGVAEMSGPIKALESDKTPVSIRIVGLAESLPNPVVRTHWKAPLPSIRGGYSMGFRNLKPGSYVVLIDGVESTRFGILPDEASATSFIQKGPEIDQVEKLRALINKKNELHFNRWRPENETYLFLFRKHEQGNNAVEIPQFDPLIEKLEAEINQLKKPVKHTYEIIREEVGK